LDATFYYPAQLPQVLLGNWGFVLMGWAKPNDVRANNKTSTPMTIRFLMICSSVVM
jgi:hypothetical protein